VVGHLVAREVERGASPQDAVAAVLPRLHGAFAIAFLFRDHPDLIIGARMGAPLTVGIGAVAGLGGAIWFGLTLPKVRVEARRLIIAQSMAGGEPAAEEMTARIVD
jgi:hypothetical protein